MTEVICSANQCTGFYIIGASVMKEFKGLRRSLLFTKCLKRVFEVFFGRLTEKRDSSEKRLFKLVNYSCHDWTFL